MTEWHSNKYWQNRSKEERLRNLRIPARYLGKDLNTYDSEAGDSEAFNAINHWVKLALFKPELVEDHDSWLDRTPAFGLA